MEDPPHKSRPSSSLSATRFLGILDQPLVSVSDSNNPLELDEFDVVWSTTASDLSDTPTTESSTATNSPSNLPRHHFRPDRFGLSAAFSDDRASLLQRKPSLNPSLSAASAARAIPPVPFPRSGSSSEDFSRSAPVDVPVWPKGGGNSRHRLSKMGFFEKVDSEEDKGDGEGEEMLPPHEIVARSQSSRTSFSVFEGVGRTLKGRDMRRVRDAVLQQTGFLD
ncbi:Senescence regulator S40 [Cinnamomum micranthum f. kanehirae]|uniref:Senescence regulator S40 n=1 Tax=Cinnamomum micranthum f. kanehirae TaxID=337451 RepID=A0A443NQL1_9MAGN|nr:Senescence regulator S40 [Cinnamomum micranthum f. kanehirae]